MVSWHAAAREVDSQADTENSHSNPHTESEPSIYSQHSWWNFNGGWKSTLNNLRLIIQPYGFFNLIKPWLTVFNIPSLQSGFLKLINIMNQFSGYVAFHSE
ncbi:transposase [Calothrix sp. NIES-4101]|nr:transposase [Calothrix sp. NIES-4101]